MSCVLPLDRMTIAEKLQALESIWDDLCQTPDNVSSPAWHGEILRRRDQRVTDGSAQFTDWSQAKREIRDAVPYYRVENGVVLGHARHTQRRCARHSTEASHLWPATESAV